MHTLDAGLDEMIQVLGLPGGPGASKSPASQPGERKLIRLRSCRGLSTFCLPSRLASSYHYGRPEENRGRGLAGPQAPTSRPSALLGRSCRRQCALLR